MPHAQPGCPLKNGAAVLRSRLKIATSVADGDVFGLSKERIGDGLKGIRPALRQALSILRIVIASCLACWTKARNSCLEIFSTP